MLGHSQIHKRRHLGRKDTRPQELSHIGIIELGNRYMISI